jgi:hypothetical protein
MTIDAQVSGAGRIPFRRYSSGMKRLTTSLADRPRPARILNVQSGYGLASILT